MIDKLEMFIALANEQHFGRAAEACGVTQPTLSAAIRQLEDQLGVQLVRRGSRYQGLTPEGVRALEWAHRIAGDARIMRAEMRMAKEGLSGKLRLAVVPTALAMVATLTRPLMERHPNLSVVIHSRNSGAVRSMVEGLEADAGITYLDGDPLGRLMTVPLYRERYLMVVSDGSPLAGRASVTWAEVAERPLCLLTEDMQNRRIINQHMAEAGARPAPRLASDSVLALIAHVRAGGWETVLPQSTAALFGSGSGLAAIPVEADSAGHRIGLIAEPREPHSPVLRALIDAAVNTASELDR
ncbi:LysR family transcriptional regulator [Tropicimonas sediminicola]|uniref:DNA-binding transcriptional regulator, LysR family n=1 Tax=Tropicimonas sediminicola TaxID=1031541 RepID=A0A239CUT6_9RHOB|nr:LysR family transcriptional regulator [Tropicimonas sediminicola]SNS23558.1 DNA-binding transcriptional regulator, LysR family [Tropicimonas sediminicola]